MALKDAKTALALNQHLTNLGKASENIALEPGLTPQEQEHFKLSRIITLAISVRNEHPALGRLADYLANSRGADGQPPKITEAQWTTLKALIGPDMSRTEREFLDHLRQTNRFDDEFRTKEVEPYRRQMGDARSAMAARAGTIRFTSNTAATAVQLGALAGAFFIHPALFAVSLVMAFAQKRTNAMIANTYENKVASFGVNAAQGGEVHDESRIALENVAGADIWHAQNAQEVAALAKQQLDVLATLREIRPQAGDNGPAAHVVNAVDGYERGLQALLASHDAKPMTVTQLKEGMLKLLGEAIRPEVVWAATTGAIQEAFGPVAGSTRANFAEVQKLLFEVAEQAIKPGEVAGPEDEVVLRQAADQFLRATRLQQRLGDDENVINSTLVAYFTAALDDPASALESKEGKKLAKDIDKVRDHVTSVHKKGTRSFIDKKQARNLGDQIVRDLFGIVLPRYVPGLDDVLTPSSGKATEKGDRIEYSVSLRGGMFGSTGKLTVEFERDGSVVADSLKIDVGRSQAQRVVTGAVERFDARVTTSRPIETRDGYTVRAELPGKPGFDVRVAKFGAPYFEDIAAGVTSGA